MLLAGLVVNGAIYARNLQLSKRPDRARIRGALRVVLAATAGGVVLAGALVEVVHEGVEGSGWRACVLAGQAAWSSRTVVQWWCAEGGEPGSLPPAIWRLSLVGDLLLFADAVQFGDPVYVAGFLLGPIVQVRNLVLGGREARAAAGVSGPALPAPEPLT